MKKLEGKRNRLGQPIKCPGLCNSMNRSNSTKEEIDANVKCQLSNKKQLVVLRRLPDNVKNVHKSKRTGFFTQYMKIFLVYIVFHSIIAALIRHHKYYPYFLAAQLCGFLTILLFPIWNRCRNYS